MSSKVTIVGATGKVGRGVMELLLEKGVNVKALVSDPDKLSVTGIETYKGDLQDAKSIQHAFFNADAAFLMIPPIYNREDYRNIHRIIAENITEAVITANVPKVVVLSSVGADLGSGNGHISTLHLFESLLKKVSGLQVMVLRCAYFMENLFNLIPMIKTSGIIGGINDPERALAMISVKDISKTAARYLHRSEFPGFNIHYLLGPREYTFSEAANILGQALGMPGLRYIKLQQEDFIAGLESTGFSSSAAQDLTEGLSALGEGKLTNHIKRNLVNTTATTFEWFANEIFVPAYSNQLVAH